MPFASGAVAVSARVLRLGEHAVRHAVGSTFFASSLARVGVQLMAVGTVIAVARYLDLQQFGAFALVSAVTVILTSLLYTGIYEFILRTGDLDADRDTAFWLLAGMGAFGAAAMAVTAFAFAGSAFAPLLIWLSLVPLLAGPTAWSEALLVRSGRIRLVAFTTLAVEMVGFCVLLVTLQAGEGVMALVWSRLTATIGGFATKLALARTLPALRAASLSGRRAMAAAAPLYLSASANLFANYGVDLLLGVFLSPAAVGAYRAGSRAASTGNDLILRPMHAITWSAFSRLERENDTVGMREAWLAQTRFIIAVAWPAMAVLALASEPLVTLVLSKSWSAAAPIVTILAVSHAVGAAKALAAPVFVCRGRADILVKLDIASALLLMLSLLAVVHLGPQWAAGAQLAVKAAVVPMALYSLAKLLDVGWRDLASAVMPGLALAVVCIVAMLGFDGIVSTSAASSDWSELRTVLVAAILTWGVGFSGLLAVQVLHFPEP
ncbi:oligosaccharide flippase family protein [Rhizobiaceae bacterium]|nr:oligosaccharide flippase family protein [Rhizobiaceae bacterium]